MVVQTVLPVRAITLACVLIALFYARCTNAQWLTTEAFFQPATADLQPVSAHLQLASAQSVKQQKVNPKKINQYESQSMRESFNAFGCGECHADLADSSYQSGFQLLADSSGISPLAQVSSAQASLSAYQPLSVFYRASPKKIVFGGETFIASPHFSSLYLRKIHRILPAKQRQQAEQSLNAFKEASEEQKKLITDYIVMF